MLLIRLLTIILECLYPYFLIFLQQNNIEELQLFFIFFFSSFTERICKYATLIKLPSASSYSSFNL